VEHDGFAGRAVDDLGQRQAHAAPHPGILRPQPCADRMRRAW
jgi:hypothetical protein